VTNNNDIILGVVEEYTFKPTDNSCRNIIAFGENKKENNPINITNVNKDYLLYHAESQM
jgi:hypothetical protein